MTATAALILVCAALCALWPLIALTNYVATTWRYGLNERARIRRQRLADEQAYALIREGMLRLERERVREREEALRRVVERSRNVVSFRRRG